MRKLPVKEGAFRASTDPKAPELSKEALAYLHKIKFHQKADNLGFDDICPYVIGPEDGMTTHFMHSEEELITFCKKILIERGVEPTLSDADMEQADEALIMGY